MKKPKLKLIAGVFALALLPAVLVLVNRPSDVQAQSSAWEGAAAPWRRGPRQEEIREKRWNGGGSGGEC